MVQYGGLEGTSTANQDLYQNIKTNEGWTSYKPLIVATFTPTADCHVRINNGVTTMPVKANQGFTDGDTQISSFKVVEAGINYIMAYRF